MLQIGMSRSSLKRSASASDVVGLREPALLDVVVGEVAHRHGRQLVEPQPQPGVAGREQVGPRLRVAAAQPGQRHTDRRGGVQGGVAQLVGDPLRVVARLQALRQRRRGRAAR